KLVVTRAEIESNGRDDLPFVLQIVAVEPTGLAAGIEDREWFVAGLSAVLVDGQDIRLGAEGRALALDQEAAAHRVLGGDPPAAVALHAARPALPVGGLGNAVEQQLTDRITRREVDVAVSGVSGDLEIEIADVLLPGEDPEIVD